MSAGNLHISGKGLQRLREVKGIKQGTIARVFHITQQALSKIEKSKLISAERTDEFLKALKYSKNDLKFIQKIFPTFFTLI